MRLGGTGFLFYYIHNWYRYETGKPRMHVCICEFNNPEGALTVKIADEWCIGR